MFYKIVICFVLLFGITFPCASCPCNPYSHSHSNSEVSELQQWENFVNKYEQRLYETLIHNQVTPAISYVLAIIEYIKNPDVNKTPNVKVMYGKLHKEFNDLPPLTYLEEEDGLDIDQKSRHFWNSQFKKLFNYFKAETVQIFQHDHTIRPFNQINRCPCQGRGGMDIASWIRSGGTSGELLIKHGADVNAKNKDGYIPLDYVNPNYPDLYELLRSNHR